MNTYVVVRQMAFTLKNLDAILEKAIRHAEARKYRRQQLLQRAAVPRHAAFHRAGADRL